MSNINPLQGRGSFLPVIRFPLFTGLNLNTFANSGADSGLVMATKTVGLMKNIFSPFIMSAFGSFTLTAVPTAPVNFYFILATRDVTKQPAVTLAQLIAAGVATNSFLIGTLAIAGTKANGGAAPSLTFPLFSTKTIGGTPPDDDYGNVLAVDDVVALDLGIFCNKNVANQVGTFDISALVANVIGQ